VRYFLDTEYNGFGGALISLALVPEYGDDEFYAIVKCPDPIIPWVERNVLPYLDTVPVGLTHPPLERLDAAQALSNYLAGDTSPEIVADWPEDIAQFCMLLLTTSGDMVQLAPTTFTLLRLPGFSTAANSKVPHNALHDARALRDHVLGVLESR
jgi:hypothetical protein